jgi:hypothetical protein
MSKYKVIEAFTDLDDPKGGIDAVYTAGDFYPRDGFSPSEGRLEALSSKKNKGNRPFIESAEYPKHTGGSYYELSDGSKVQGKAKAFEAEAELEKSDA